MAAGADRTVLTVLAECAVLCCAVLSCAVLTLTHLFFSESMFSRCAKSLKRLMTSLVGLLY